MHPRPQSLADGRRSGCADAVQPLVPAGASTREGARHLAATGARPGGAGVAQGTPGTAHRGPAPQRAGADGHHRSTESGRSDRGHQVTAGSAHAAIAEPAVARSRARVGRVAGRRRRTSTGHPRRAGPSGSSTGRRPGRGPVLGSNRHSVDGRRAPSPCRPPSPSGRCASSCSPAVGDPSCCTSVAANSYVCSSTMRYVEQPVPSGGRRPAGRGRRIRGAAGGGGARRRQRSCSRSPVTCRAWPTRSRAPSWWRSRTGSHETRLTERGPVEVHHEGGSSTR